MPGMAAPPVPPPIAPAVSGFEVASTGPSLRSSYRQNKRQSGPNPIVLWGAVILFASTVVIAAVYIAADMNSGPQQTTAYDEGYEWGHSFGELARNNGSGFDPDGSFQDQAVTSGVVELQSEGKHKGYMPKTGTPEFGDWRAGYYAGYKSGFAGHR